MSQLFQDNSAGDIRLDSSDGTMLNVKSQANWQQQAKSGNVFDRRTSDQSAVVAIGGLQPDTSSSQSNQPQPPFGPGDPDISQKTPEKSTDIAQSCSASPQKRMLLRPREDSCSNIPSKTNFNPTFYPGGEDLYEKAKSWGVEQERKRCNPFLKTLCCNGPRAFPVDIKDCAECKL